MNWAGGRKRVSVIPSTYRQDGPGCSWKSSWDGSDLTAEEILAISSVFYNFQCSEARKAPGVKKSSHASLCTSPGPATFVVSRIPHLALVWPFSWFWAEESMQAREWRWREGLSGRGHGSSSIEMLSLSHPLPSHLHVYSLLTKPALKW